MKKLKSSAAALPLDVTDGTLAGGGASPKVANGFGAAAAGATGATGGRAASAAKESGAVDQPPPGPLADVAAPIGVMYGPPAALAGAAGAAGRKAGVVPAGAGASACAGARRAAAVAAAAAKLGAIFAGGRATPGAAGVGGNGRGGTVVAAGRAGCAVAAAASAVDCVLAICADGRWYQTDARRRIKNQFSQRLSQTGLGAGLVPPPPP